MNFQNRKAQKLWMNGSPNTRTCNQRMQRIADQMEQAIAHGVRPRSGFTDRFR